ncbi:MAG: hypothetical protein ACE5KO_03385 [Candidatus Bathyarchaeia archaeon]
MDKVFAWCTDYQPDDVRFHPWARSRKVVSSSKEKTLIESETQDGKTRVVTVKLMPPDRWESFSDDFHTTYTLEKIEEGTRFTFKGESLGEGASSFVAERVNGGAERTWDSIIKSLEEEIPQ